jgi:transposase
LSEAYADHQIILVLDNAPSHTAKEIEVPENIELLALPTYSPELNPVERWFEEFRRELSNRIFETISSLQTALTETLESYWRDPGRLRSLTGFPWWVRAIEKLRHQSP